MLVQFDQLIEFIMKKYLLASLLGIFALSAQNSFAQFGEPDVQK